MAIAKDSHEICLRCGESNREGTSRCQKCKAPLDTSARDHPWEMKTANHHAYAAATPPPAAGRAPHRSRSHGEDDGADFASEETKSMPESSRRRRRATT